MSTTARAVSGQTAPGSSATTTAFVGVSVVPMDTNRVLTDQTVIVRAGVVDAIGSRATLAVPSGATAIDGGGRYLLPGLTDAHAHLVGDGTGFGDTRVNFGDAPLYLAHGVTTVFNLRGSAEQLEWRRRIAAGDLIGPTIYTAGEFVNEPRVMSPDDVEREIDGQARAGFDIIKFHEIFEPGVGNVTTVGLSRDAYLRMNEAARARNIPLIGHAPVTLGLDAMLAAHQTVAHIGMLSNIYFFPLASHSNWLIATAVSFVVLVLVAVTTVVSYVNKKWRLWSRAETAVARGRRLATTAVLFAAMAALAAAFFLPGGPWFASNVLRVLFTTLAVAVAGVGAMLLALLFSARRDQGTTASATLEIAALTLATIGLSASLLAFWVPIAWRSSPAGIARLAERLRDAGVSVETTIVTYDALGGPGRAALMREPTLAFLRADVQSRWRDTPAVVPESYRYTDFVRAVARALHEKGVPLIAGTDAMGFPFVAPGSSLHRELDLLVASGLSPYDAIRAATVAPAVLLGKGREFGSIAAGQRADLLLVEANPLADLTVLRRPLGVMARGRWFPRERLTSMMEELREAAAP